jgi:hypothetical protein
MCELCEHNWAEYANDRFLKAEQQDACKVYGIYPSVDMLFPKSKPKQEQSMTKGGHPRFHEIVQQMSDLHDRKNTDYAAGAVEGPLGNFLRVSTIKKLYPGFDWDSPFGTAMDFMLKQFDAAFTLRSQKRDSVTGEPIASRLTDIAVYAVLGIILEEEEQKC